MRKRNWVIVYQLPNIIPDQPGTIHPKGCVTGCMGHVKYYRSRKDHVEEIIGIFKGLSNSNHRMLFSVHAKKKEK